jgi:hypothetical protein
MTQYRDAIQEEMMPQRQMLEILMNAWFKCNYIVPRDDEDRKRAVQITRGELRERLNAYLVRLGFQEIGNKDPLWCEWFLGTCVGLSDKERSTGKAIALEQCVNKSNVKRALEQVIREIEDEQQREEEGEPSLVGDTLLTVKKESNAT